eukprot:GGOE01005257.1.p2 GENE.GGOE01005257.1~~GGOE01005257.1.p2  ORF type:complete len:170 (+),score=69.31 GGOE01005257.1:858-1367(+)
MLAEVQQEELVSRQRIHLLEHRLSTMLEADLDHRLATLEQLNSIALEEENRHLLDRIAAAERNSWHQLEGSLGVLEATVDGMMFDKLQARVGTAEQRFKALAELRIIALEKTLSQFIDMQTAHASRRLSTSWYVPFGVMLAVLAVFMGNVWHCLGWLAARMMQRLDRCV